MPERPRLDGRYELMSAIGRGGMSTVYRAIQHPIGRSVAVKILPAAPANPDTARAARRFFREAKAIAELHHPHIVPLFDFGEAESGDRYLVMELLPGESLAALMKRETRLTLDRAVVIADQVLDALAEAHAHGIVHRDLKPENIQIGRRGEREDFVTVMDFGIARETDEHAGNHRTTIEVAGTPAYMAPEQILGTTVDPRTDLYAVGVLLFEMLVGRLPFDAKKTVDVYVGHLRGPLPRLPVELTGITGLQELLDRALAKSADARIPDAQSFRRALRGLAPGRLTQITDPPKSGSQHVEMVAALDGPPTAPFENLLAEWALDVAQHGGTVNQRSAGRLGALFAGHNAGADALRAATALKQRTRERRHDARLPFFLRVGIHEHQAIAERLREEAPRDGVVVADAAASGDFRLIPAGEIRIRGYKQPLAMLQLVSPRV